MADLLHQMEVGSTCEQVFGLLTEGEQLRHWWTGDSVAEPRVGTIAEFGFSDRQVLFRMRIDGLDPPHRVVWSCLGDAAEWEGTRLVWEIAPTEDGCRLDLLHGGWTRTDGIFALCNSTWGCLMYRLRDHAEGKEPGPLFSGRARC